MSQLTVENVVKEIDAVHRELARLSVDQLRGVPSAVNILDIIESHPIPLRPKTVTFLRKAMRAAESIEAARRIDRIIFGCMDLAVEEQTASLEDMLKFYLERGWMHVGTEKIPALEVVLWLQVQSDFSKREIMQKENTIFLKGIVNPMLLGILELSIRTVAQQFGFENYARFSEAKKQVSFDEQARIFLNYLDKTSGTYRKNMAPWVEEKIGKPFENLSRYHALYLLRIQRFDSFFPVSRLKTIVGDTFKGLGFDLSSRSDVIAHTSNSPAKNPNGMCIGVEIPGEVHVLMKPVGGLIDVETLLHETGHAFFLSHFDPSLPIEDRRLYRSTGLDEAFAFLFMDLIDNPAWLTGTAEMPAKEADALVRRVRTKRLCLVRRYIGKFLAEKEFHETGDIKNTDSYCRHLNAATGFVYEPAGYLVDMEPDFYALDYLHGWAAAHVLRGFLEAHFGAKWFQRAEAGAFLREIAASGRRNSVDHVIQSFCGEPPRLPNFSDN